MELAEQINILAEFCGVRDINELNQNNLDNSYGFKQADVMVLFDLLPRIFSTRSRKALELIEVCKPLIDSMPYNTIVNSKDATTHERVYQTKIILEDLGRFLNEDFFNE